MQRQAAAAAASPYGGERATTPGCRLTLLALLPTNLLVLCRISGNLIPLSRVTTPRVLLPVHHNTRLRRQAHFCSGTFCNRLIDSITASIGWFGGKAFRGNKLFGRRAGIMRSKKVICQGKIIRGATTLKWHCIIA